jgi:nucleolar protein 56
VRSVVTTWYGCYLVEGSSVLRSVLAPTDPAGLAERVRARREGRLTPEEEAVLSERANDTWSTRDRRLIRPGVRWDSRAPRWVERSTDPTERTQLRAALLADADRSLEAAWDPSVHLQEAVRATSDLDRVRNLLGERLGSWVSRDAPELDPGDRAAVLAAALESDVRRFGPVDPALRDARRQLADLYRAVESARAGLERAVRTSVPERTANLSALLGPELAARLLSQAGGLERLARLPASTIQVLGAEKAFFEHLRGRAPPPRHGLLFLHPALQSAGRTERGRLARALAGKVAIAARLDLAGAPRNEVLERSFAARREALRAQRGTRSGAKRERRSRAPLHRASQDR